MRLSITQNQVWKFNWAWHEDSLSFYMIIERDDRKTLATIHISDSEYPTYTRDTLKDLYNNFEIQDIIDMWKDYAKKVISTTDYKAQCELFEKLFYENLDELKKHRIEILKIEKQDAMNRYDALIHNTIHQYAND